MIVNSLKKFLVSMGTVAVLGASLVIANGVDAFAAGTVTLHYHRDDGNYSDYTCKTWDEVNSQGTSNTFTEGDGDAEIEYLAKKCTNLRVFDDENGVMNKSIIDIGGNILSISQFTLYGDASKGNRPSYIKALGGEEATRLYDKFNEKLRECAPVETGIFGADMEIEEIKDGPVTIIIDSK